MAYQLSSKVNIKKKLQEKVKLLFLSTNQEDLNRILIILINNDQGIFILIFIFFLDVKSNQY